MKKFTFKDRLLCFFSLEWLIVPAIYFCFLIPLTVGAAYLCRLIDRTFNFPPLLPAPYNWISFLVLTLLGGMIIFWSYTYLILEGEGGPVPPFTPETKRLVTSGPYALVRHPSIGGKLLGVIGLGLLFNSLSFTFFLVPLLLAGSIILNLKVQEKIVEKRLGKEYLDYQKRVPMLLPDLKNLKQVFRSR